MHHNRTSAFVLAVFVLVFTAAYAPAQDVPAPATSSIKRYGVVPFRPGGSPNAPLTGSVSPQCNSPQLSYFNGPVVSNVRVVPVLWGSFVNSQVQQNIGQFYADATVSNWYDMLSEYASVGGTNQSIGRGSSAPAITISPSLCASSASCTITDAQLQSELASQIQGNALPPPQLDGTGNTNTAYMVHFPPNVNLQGPSGAGTSCVQFCAYHNTFTFGSGNIALPYGAIMDTFTSACSMGCGNNGSALANQTSTAAHELSEIVTDADIGLDTQSAYAFPAAWADNNNQCGEIADICDDGVSPGSTITVDGRPWIVQQLWSNARGACLGSGLNPNYAVSAPAAIPAGSNFTFTVTARNPSGNKGTDTAYVGTVHFTSSDPAAVLPGDFTYVPEDQGTHNFNALLNAQGSQTITATDTLNGNIVGTSGTISVMHAGQCGGASNSNTAFFDDFPGTGLDPARWSAQANGGTIAVAGNSVSLSAANGASFPYVAAVGTPIPPAGDFSVRWIATYGAQQSAGTGSLAITAALPSSGAGSWLDVADAWQDSSGYRVQVQNPAGTQTPAYTDSAPAVVQHDVEYCWLSSGTLAVYVDGAQAVQQVRDPGVPRPTTLWFGNPSNSVNTWQSFTLNYVEVRALNDDIFKDGFGN